MYNVIILNINWISIQTPKLKSKDCQTGKTSYAACERYVYTMNYWILKVKGWKNTKILIFPKLNYKFNAIPIKIPTGGLCKLTSWL